MLPSDNDFVENCLGYRWLVGPKVVGFEPSTQLTPWYFLTPEARFVVQDRWPSGPCGQRLIAFARRQDNDDIACMKRDGGVDIEIVLIEGWQSAGFDVIESYPNLWSWMKSVIDDIAQVASVGEALNQKF